MIKVIQDNDQKPGTWKGLALSGGGRSASLTCPEYSQVAALTDHEIDANGVVMPSVICPKDGCTFHDYVVLEGWAA